MTMAYANETRRAPELSILSRVAELRSDLVERFAQFRLYRATLNELASLSDRDLADLGLHRGMIADVAREASYKA